MKEFWDKRYSNKEFAYGQAPNIFFKEQIDNLKPGKLLLPAEGEGRNAIYAAKQGWQVDASDISSEGKINADRYASKEQVSINYAVGDFGKTPYAQGSFDAIGLIYAHFSATIKNAYHQMINSYLKPGGTLIFEAFSKNQLELNTINPKAGGPKNLQMLFSIDELKEDFKNYDIQVLEEKKIDLAEGDFHVGKSAVIRFVGKKK